MDGSFDIAIIGAGSAGLTAADVAHRLGASVAIIEKGRVGGDCTWTGCIPSKALLRTARLHHERRNAQTLGLSSSTDTADFSVVSAHVRHVIEDIYADERPEVLRAKGITVFEGPAEFEDAHSASVGSERVAARRFIICSGATPRIPPIPGLEDVDYATYQSLWDMRVLPKRLTILGGGPIGCEMAQAFSRLGSSVTLLEAGPRLLPRDDVEASHMLLEIFRNEGIYVQVGSAVTGVRQDSQGIHATTKEQETTGDVLLVATGRHPQTDGLRLERAGIRHDERGIQVNSHLRTSNSHVFAAGDCTGGFQFTHYAGWQAGVAVRNALLPGNDTGVRDTVPWTTFTNPEVAHAGLTEVQARKKHGSDVAVTVWPLEKVDRAHTDGDTRGFMKVITRRNGRLLGVTIMASRAGEMLHEWIVALGQGMRIDELSQLIHVYPTYSMGAMEAAADIRITRLTAGYRGRLLQLARRLS